MRCYAHIRQLRREAERGKGIVKHAARLRLGEITTDQFLRETARDWHNLARTLHNAYRNKLPDSLGVEDLAQEMQMEALRVMPRWNPSARCLGDFLVFNGCSKARKTLNKERQAEGRSGKNPSRHPIPASRLVRRSDEGKATNDPLDRGAVDADQEERLAGRELYRELTRELGRAAPRAIRILREGGKAAQRFRELPAIVRAIEQMSRDT